MSEDMGDASRKFTDLPMIIGTAGHVDHGKTTLIRALTGVDTDRLAEEKRRGMTIDLGFAPFRLPSGRQAGVVDVPGHERFLKNMLAGAGGMDLVMLVVAADDGVMPQTREHLDILSMLHVPRGIVVVTKVDAVDPELLELAIDDVRSALGETFMANAPILPVSAVSGAGLPELLAAIEAAADAQSPRDANRSARLPIDRVFVKQGFGTVVTGTLFAGTLREGDTVAIEPSGLTSRVRGLHVHGEKRHEARAGQRVAINLAGLEKHAIGRGDWVVTPGTVAPSTLLDVHLELLPGAPPLAHRTRVRLHHGTAELIGRVVLLEGVELAPGKAGPVQLILEKPVVAAFGDRFVIRLYAPPVVIGGGQVLHATPAKHKRGQAGTLAALEKLEDGDAVGAIAAALVQAGRYPVEEATLLAFAPSEHRVAARDWLRANAFTVDADHYLDTAIAGDMATELTQALEKYHAQVAWRVGLGAVELAQRTKLPLIVVSRLLAAMEQRGSLTQFGRFYAQPGRVPRLTPELANARQGILDRLRQAPLADQDDFTALGAGDRLGSLLEDLTEAGEILRISGGVYVASARLVELKARLQAHFATQPQLTASQARELIETTRKYIIPFLEFLDSQNFTRRMGDVRVLKTPSS